MTRRNTPSEFDAHSQNDISDRLDFLGLDAASRAHLAGLESLVAAEIEPALAALYRRVERFPTTRDFFATPAVTAHARARQADHWRLLAAAAFDPSYVRAVRRIGETHARLGLSPQWYIGGYGVVAEHLLRVILDPARRVAPGQAADEAVSLMKAILVDMDLGISVYLEALEERRQREEAGRLVAEANQTEVVRALATALARVAEGDLSASVEQDVSPEHQQLKDDFNGALAQLVAAQQGIEAGSRAKSDFLSNISHEIRTPLNGVIGVAGALAATPLTPDQQGMVDLIKLSAETVERLLSDLLDVSKIEAGALRIEAAPFNLQQVVRGAVELFRARATASGINLELRTDCGEAWLLGDAVRIAQIVSNLVSNAVKFTDDGGVEVLLSCQPGDADPDDVDVRLEVRDTGIGFDPETATRLFQRFSQADSSITRRYGGTGLGLSICRGIVEAMDGRIEAASRPGEGSRFIVSLRLRRANQPALGEAFARPLPDDLAPRDGPALSVLLVEDHPINRQVARLILDPLGFDVVEARDGAEALQRVSERAFDVVLMDMQMPVMDGLTATREIRAFEARTGRPPTRLIMLTANASEDHRAEAEAAGADDHVPKPIQRGRLLASLLPSLSPPDAGVP